MVFWGQETIVAKGMTEEGDHKSKGFQSVFQNNIAYHCMGRLPKAHSLNEKALFAIMPEHSHWI